MKKIYILLLLLVLGITGCTPSTNNPIDDKEDLIIYSLNDFHGSVINNDGGLSVIGSYLMNQTARLPDNTVILAAGDMFQGSALSNMSTGNVVVEMMNTIGFDAMTVGNHEFDWGVSVIEGLKDGQGVDANFPILAANIYDKATNKPVNWAKPYTIITKGDIKIGVIGVIGEGLTSDISPTIAAPYEFKEIIPIIKDYTKILRNKEKVDVVIVSAHDNTENNINKQLADLSGEYQIDAIINGHTHSHYYGVVKGIDNLNMPYVQSGSSGSYIGRITLQLDENNHLINGTATNIEVHSSLAAENSNLKAIVERYNEQVSIISEEVLGISGTQIDRNQGTAWAADVIQITSQQQIGLINTGGIRSNAFPINNDESITVGRIWEIMPFDNTVIWATVKASDIVDVSYKTSIQLSSNAYINGNTLYINNQAINPNDEITLATIDFLFDNNDYNLNRGSNINRTGELFRDYLISNLRQVCANNNKWVGNAQ